MISKSQGATAVPGRSQEDLGQAPVSRFWEDLGRVVRSSQETAGET